MKRAYKEIADGNTLGILNPFSWAIFKLIIWLDSKLDKRII